MIRSSRLTARPAVFRVLSPLPVSPGFRFCREPYLYRPEKIANKIIFNIISELLRSLAATFSPHGAAGLMENKLAGDSGMETADTARRKSNTNGYILTNGGAKRYAILPDLSRKRGKAGIWDLPFVHEYVPFVGRPIRKK